MPAAAPTIDFDVRRHFPLLERRIDGRPIIYLDSAATGLKPRAVLDAEAAYSRQYSANVHRGKHALSEEASEAYEGGRRRIAMRLGVQPRHVIFVRGATEGLNMVARGLRLERGDTVLLPIGEHHSNIVPWMREASVHWLEAHPCEPLDVEAVIRAIEATRPRVLSFAHASSVTGAIHPVREICAAARERGVLTCIDASQSAPHLRIDVAEIGCDFLTFSGHKCLGPTGIGVLTGTQSALAGLDPLLLGGGCIDRVTETGFTLKELPYRLEAGTPNISGAIGLAAALDFLHDIGFDTIGRHQGDLADALADALPRRNGLVLMSAASPRLALGSLGIVSNRVKPDDVAVALSMSYGIMVRSGFHCAHPLFDRFGHANGALRASASIYNTAEEVHYFGEALGRILRLFGE